MSKITKQAALALMAGMRLGDEFGSIFRSHRSCQRVFKPTKTSVIHPKQKKKTFGAKKLSRKNRKRK